MRGLDRYLISIGYRVFFYLIYTIDMKKGKGQNHLFDFVQ
jgi:hypothetical protein